MGVPGFIGVGGDGSTPDLHVLLRGLQAHLADGLLVVVGSGMSVAQGLPSMTTLAEHLVVNMPSRLAAEWAPVAASVRTQGLEAALRNAEVSPDLAAAMRRLTAELVAAGEADALRAILAEGRVPGLGLLLGHLAPIVQDALPVVTTNSDRLIEVSAEVAGWGVDSQFTGHYLAQERQTRQPLGFVQGVARAGKGYRLQYRQRIDLCKPHGSLDWFDLGGQPVRSALPFGQEPLIITPGAAKYKDGYARPFDRHRERANHQIDSAARFLILGYGFNDDHLETHLAPRMRAGAETVILTRELTLSAKTLLRQCPRSVALCSRATPDSGFELHTASGSAEYDGDALWQLTTFVEKGVA